MKSGKTLRKDIIKTEVMMEIGMPNTRFNNNILKSGKENEKRKELANNSTISLIRKIIQPQENPIGSDITKKYGRISVII